MSPPSDDLTQPSPAPLASAGLDNIAAAVRALEHPSQIGPYFVTELVGEGGMGTVYKAEQRSPIQRTVAIKIIKLGMDTRQIIRRFEAERSVLALMDHPNVARVIDAGATPGGSPYFVMEFVDGESITSFADRARLKVKQRLELFIQACEAVQHAHQKAVIHRDLKPSNILVTDVDGKPRVKVIDFGVAKAIDQRVTERSMFTELGQFVGTPEYMAPEQAEGGLELDIDTRGDVYSLGVVLYELLTGSLPFEPKSLRSAGYREIQRIIREVEPPRPSTRLSALGGAAEGIARLRQTPLETLERELKSELEWIPLKAMRKDRAQRYASATELADDIHNYLANRPLRAGPESRVYRAKKFLRRNKALVSAIAVVLIVLLAGVIGTTWQAIRARRESVVAATERDNAQAVLKFFTDGVIAAADPVRTKGKPVTVQEAVDIAAEKIDESLKGRPLIEASVRLSISDTYRSLGNYERALPFAKRAYELRRAQLGDDAFETVVALSRYANIFIHLQRPADAEPLVRQNLAATMRLKGPDDPETFSAQSNLGNVLIQQGRFADAEPFMQAQFEGMKRHFGEGSFAVAQAAHNYGALLFRLGRLNDAERLCREAFEWSLKKDGLDDPDTCAFGNSLAVILGELGRHEESVELGKKIWDARVRVLGKDNPETVHSCIQYANHLGFVGRGEEGAAILKQVVESQLARAPESRMTLDAMLSYGQVLVLTSHHQEAAATYKDLWERRKKVLEPDHPDTLVAEMNYAAELAQIQRATEAEPLLRETAEKSSKRLGPQSRLCCYANGKLAVVLNQLNRPAEAEPFARSALEGLSKVFGDHHPEVARTAQVLAASLGAQNRADEAAQVISKYALPTTAHSPATHHS